VRHARDGAGGGCGSSPPTGTLRDAAGLSVLTEAQALALLRGNDAAPEVLEQLSKNSSLMKSRKLRLALVEHPRTARCVSLPMVRRLFTFELMRVALAPAVPADVRLAADEALTQRLEAVSFGERLTLARRASGRVAGVLLLDGETRVIQAALENPRLTEAGVIKALARHDAPAAFVHAVCHHARWSVRREVRIALLRKENIPLARALEFARSLPRTVVREILQGSRLPENLRTCLLCHLQQARDKARHSRS
jgi:hypothetical protein